MFTSRIVDAAARAGIDLRTAHDPSELPHPDEVELVLVDWNDRQDGWAERLREWRDGVAAPRPRLVLFGSHTDLAAHAEAKRHGIGAVLARSAFVQRLPALMAEISKKVDATHQST